MPPSKRPPTKKKPAINPNPIHPIALPFKKTFCLNTSLSDEDIEIDMKKLILKKSDSFDKQPITAPVNVKKTFTINIKSSDEDDSTDTLIIKKSSIPVVNRPAEVKRVNQIFSAKFYEELESDDLEPCSKIIFKKSQLQLPLRHLLICQHHHQQKVT